MSGGFYLYLSSKDSENIYKSNNYKDFYVEFDHQIVLEQSCGFGFERQWQVALTELSIDFLNTDQTLPEGVVVLTELCEPSYINGTQLSILRTIASSAETNASLYNTYYVGVVVSSFNRIRIQLKNRDLKELQLEKGWPQNAVLQCTLHFIKN